MPIIFYNMHMNLNPYKIHRASKGRRIDNLEQCFIQKYNREHTYTGGGKSLARPRKKQANVSVRM